MVTEKWATLVGLLVSFSVVGNTQEPPVRLQSASATTTNANFTKVAPIASTNTTSQEVSLVPELAIAQIVWGDQIRLTLNPVAIVDTQLQDYEVSVPYTENVAQNYTANVPYTVEEIGADGQKRKITKLRPEKRTRTVPVEKTRKETRQRKVQVTRVVPRSMQTGAPKELTFPIEQLRFVSISGQPVAADAIASLLAKPSPIVVLRGNATVSPLFLKLCKNETLVLRLQ